MRPRNLSRHTALVFYKCLETHQNAFYRSLKTQLWLLLLSRNTAIYGVPGPTQHNMLRNLIFIGSI